uniref:uncharacterized protein LOC122604630 n=1 Tax=Erigeron canadensis TaxID=72917 RepID=UPI001CB9A2B7|nr:uncharacterized protein LOC122604630 [Erigeron canadensis]
MRIKKGYRDDYLKIGVPLYEASVKCDWKVAKSIFEKRPELVRYSITENGETALHVAASAKGPTRMEEFVKNLVGLMNPEDLTLENENFNTALYLAAAAGNLETVKIMIEKNRDLLTIPGAGRQMLPLYAAALFGNYEVVKYLFLMSNNLGDEEGWTSQNRGWLVDKCVENDMFDIALQIVERYPEIGRRGNLLLILAGKPEAFPETKSNNFGRTTKPGKISSLHSVLTFIRSKLPGKCEKEKNALPLLKAVWNEIVKLPKKDIDRILRGPPDSLKQDKSASGRAIQAIQLQNLISKHVAEMLAISTNPLRVLSASIKQDTKPGSGKEIDQSLELQNLISAQLVSLHVQTQNIIKETPDSLSPELEKLIFEHIVKLNENTRNIIKTTAKKNQVQIIQKAIYKHAYEMDKEKKRIINKDAYSNRVLFIAAETGNTNFLVELIRLYPDLIWKVNDDGLSIFHIAVKHRHEGIYNLLYEIGSMKDMITPLKDPNDNNMLHLVGMSAKRKQVEDVPGVALQMQRELLWFQEVWNMVPPSHRERKNKDGLTPHELFTKEHQEMVSEGEKWMKKIAAQCIVVAALIATMVFTAAFTVPGGFDQMNGIPVFHSKVSFQIFVVTDAISLLLSTASILHMFLSIFTSHYDEGDFLVSLPKKLTVGLTYLFISIASMLVAFCTGFFVLYQKGLLWMPILISSFALLSFFLSVKMHLFAFFKVFFSTFNSILLFKPKKSVLYYENPKV